MPDVRCNTPDGAFYVFPDVSELFGKSSDNSLIINDIEMCFYLLEKAGVATVPGSAFGNAACIRLSYATSEAKINEGMRRMKEGVGRLKT
jgi:aspartate aminotransferase